MSHFPRKPVRFIEENQELLDIQKAVSGGPHTSMDYRGPTEDVFKQKMEPTYRVPHYRVNGNEIFRRLPDGSLDLEYAKDKVVEAIHKVRDKGPLTGADQMALSCLFPGTFSDLDGSMIPSLLHSNLKITPQECAKVCQLVSTHLVKEMEFMLSSHAR